MSDVVAAGRVLAGRGLVDAFGHLSVRAGDGALITPPAPLGALQDGCELDLPLGDLPDLPPGVPKEAWIHHAIYRARPDAGAICRAQPPSVLAVAAVTDALPALHGQGAMVGAPVPVFDDARLVREPERGAALAECLGNGWAVVMRGNGAVTAGRTLAQATARMVVLERQAQVFLAAAAAGEPRPLRDEEVAAWQRAADELLERLHAYLITDEGAAP